MSANDLSSLTAMYGVLGPSGNKAQSLQNAKNAAIKLQNSANSILRGRK